MTTESTGSWFTAVGGGVGRTGLVGRRALAAGGTVPARPAQRTFGQGKRNDTRQRGKRGSLQRVIGCEWSGRSGHASEGRTGQNKMRRRQERKMQQRRQKACGREIEGGGRLQEVTSRKGQDTGGQRLRRPPARAPRHKRAPLHPPAPPEASRPSADTNRGSCSGQPERSYGSGLHLPSCSASLVCVKAGSVGGWGSCWDLQPAGPGGEVVQDRD